MQVRGYEIGYPHLLLFTLLLVVLTVGIFGLSISSATFGSYNPSWDGSRDLRVLASETGAETELAETVTAYKHVPANRTVAFILSPTESYSDADSARISSFLDQGGTLVVASDFEPHANALLQDLGVRTRFDGRPLRDEQQYYRAPALPVATHVQPSTFTKNVTRVTLNHPTALIPGRNATVLVNSSGYAYFDANGNESLDATESLGTRPVVAVEPYGRGRVLLVSDPSVFVNAMLDTPDNRRFAKNIVAGSDDVLFDYSHRNGVPWAVGLVLSIAESPFLQFGLIVTLVGLGIAAWIWREPVLERRDGQHSEVPTKLPREAVVTYVEQEHPDWDVDRVQRVVNQVERNDGEP